MIAYKGSFKKKNGEVREMVFAHIADLPKAFLETKVLGAGSEQKYPDGMKLVWDLEVDNFRVFNFNTADSVKEVSIDESHFN